MEKLNQYHVCMLKFRIILFRLIFFTQVDFQFFCLLALIHEFNIDL